MNNKLKELHDFELIDKVLDGNDQAFSHIVDRYKNIVAATVVGMLGDTEEADDVGQETFIRLYKNLNKFRRESGLKTFITRIAINLSLNALKSRKRKKELFLSENEHVMNMNRGVDEIGSVDNQQLVQMALSQLEEKDRAVIVLRMLQGYSTKETSQMLKIPLGTVLSRLSRAQEKLKTLIKQLEETGLKKKNHEQ